MVKKRKKRKTSKRNYSKKIYLSPDKNDLRGTFPKWMMIIWSIICLAGAIFVWRYSGIISIILLFLSWTFLSYTWGSKTWGKTK